MQYGANNLRSIVSDDGTSEEVKAHIRRLLAMLDAEAEVDPAKL